MTKIFNTHYYIIFFLFISIASFGQYTASGPINLSGASNITIQNKSFTSGSNGAAIYLSNCSNVKIINCSFSNIPTYVGVQLMSCTNIEIVSCKFDDFFGGVYAVKGSGINVHCNSFTHIVGPKPRGQIVQFNSVSGAGNRINYNTSEQAPGFGVPEDLINCYASSGTSADPIQIIGNQLRGGGPSTTGGGIMIGDNGGHDILVSDNILVDPGQYGIGAPAGYNLTIKNNKVYARQQAFTNVGIYVGLQGEITAGFPCVASTIRVEGNMVNWTNKNGAKSNFYNCPCCTGIISSGNIWNAAIDASILPATLSLNSTMCSVANKVPTVSLTSPVNNSSYTAPATISLTATASDVDGTISKVEFYNGSVLLNSDASAPYFYSWLNVASGTYVFTAKAYDNSGAVSTSTSSTVTVKTATVSNILPSVTLTSPVNNSNYTAPATISLTATASDVDGTISKVEFYNGSVLLNSDASAPYSYSWLNGVSGTYTITAKAYDNTGAASTSTASTVNVKTATVSNVAPSVTLTSPIANSSYTAPATITISATATDSDGSIAKVEFYNGTTLLYTDISSPYSFSWSGVSSGSYTISAKAYDNLGASKTTAGELVTVTSVITTIGINGNSCVTAGQTYSYTMIPEYVPYSTISFWTNSPAVITPDPSDKRKASITFPSSLNGTSVTLYCGVNYGVSPWYREYTKVIKVGGCTTILRVAASPQPFSQSTTITVQDYNILSVHIFDSKGSLVSKQENINMSEVELGNELSTGIYFVLINTSEGSQVTKIMKE